MIVVCVVDLKWDKCESSSAGSATTGNDGSSVQQCTKSETNTLRVAFTLGFAGKCIGLCIGLMMSF